MALFPYKYLNGWSCIGWYKIVMHIMKSISIIHQSLNPLAEKSAENDIGIPFSFGLPLCPLPIGGVAALVSLKT
jgi:hypothetical protein